MEAPSEYLIVRNDKKEEVDAIKTPEILFSSLQFLQPDWKTYLIVKNLGKIDLKIN